MKNVARVEPATLEQAPLISGEAPAVRSPAPARGGSPSKVFRAWSPEQTAVLPASSRDHLGNDHLAVCLLNVLPTLNMQPILDAYPEARGQLPYDARMMTVLLLYVYSQGMTSSRQIGRRGDELAAAARPAPKAHCSFTDPESRIMKTAERFQLLCDNARGAVTVGSQLIVAGDVVQAPNDTQQLQPMVDQGIANVGVPDGVTADSGYFSEANVQSVEQLPPLLVARRGEREGRVPAGLRGPQSRQAVADRGGRGAPDAVTATRPLRDDFADSSSP